jgi:hypothetical protein
MVNNMNKHWSSAQEFLLNFYKSFIRPLIDYANFPYLIAKKTTKDKISPRLMWYYGKCGPKINKVVLFLIFNS